MSKKSFKIITEKEVVTTEVIETEVTLLQFIGHKLREEREKADINQVQLSRRLENGGYSLSNSTIGKIEKGLCPLRVEDLAALSNLFGVKMSTLYPEGLL
tara:strand:- start:148 stop:447 length:300 start_codon:yes stop_codon:yes gene_type:complete